MIEIDMPLPERCYECPMSHWVCSGEHEGRLMCNALEASLIRAGNLIMAGNRGIESCLVNENAAQRPENCPIRVGG